MRSLVVFGALMTDRLGRSRAAYAAGTSNPGTVISRAGGVGANIARTAHCLGVPVRLISRVGRDAAGDALVEQLRALGMRVEGLSRSGRCPTAAYLAMHDQDGELIGAINDMQIMEEITPDMALAALGGEGSGGFVLSDCNMARDVIEALARAPERPEFVLEATSEAKVEKCRAVLDRVDLLFANLGEIEALASTAFDGAEEACAWARENGVKSSVVSQGGRGVAVDEGGEPCVFEQLAATPVDVTGAGDALVAGTLYGLSCGMALTRAVHYGRAAAALTVESAGAAPLDLTLARLTDRLGEADISA